MKAGDPDLLVCHTTLGLEVNPFWLTASSGSAWWCFTPASHFLPPRVLSCPSFSTWTLKLSITALFWVTHPIFQNNKYSVITLTLSQSVSSATGLYDFASLLMGHAFVRWAWLFIKLLDFVVPVLQGSNHLLVILKGKLFMSFAKGKECFFVKFGSCPTAYEILPRLTRSLLYKRFGLIEVNPRLININQFYSKILIIRGM